MGQRRRCALCVLCEGVAAVASAVQQRVQHVSGHEPVQPKDYLPSAVSDRSGGAEGVALKDKKAKSVEDVIFAIYAIDTLV